MNILAASPSYTNSVNGLATSQTESSGQERRASVDAGSESPSYRVSMSAEDQSVARAERDRNVSESYDASVNEIVAQQAASLKDLPPLTFFTQADVENYQQTLMAELNSRGIDTSEPIDFGFDYQGKVIVKNDHPDKAAIEAIFEDDMDLRNGMVQTSNYFLFQEIYELHQQWADKIDSGVSEEVAGAWLVNTVQSAVSKSGEGITLSDGKFTDPFSSASGNTHALKAYQL